MVTSSFYGKQKPIYLTPLERKAIKESLPAPPPSPPLPSPPSQEKNKKTNKKNGKGGRKVKGTAGSRNAQKTGIQHYTTSVKAIKLSKLNRRFVYKEVAVSQSCFVGCLQLSEIRF